MVDSKKIEQFFISLNQIYSTKSISCHLYKNFEKVNLNKYRLNMILKMFDLKLGPAGFFYLHMQEVKYKHIEFLWKTFHDKKFSI